MTGIQITTEDTKDARLQAWAREQGLNPERITMQAGCLPEIWDGYIIYGLTFKDEDGHDLVDQFHDRVFVVGRSKKLKSPLPAGLGRVIDSCEQLVAHGCPTCEAAGVTFAAAASNG